MPILFQKCDHKRSSLQHTHGAAPPAVYCRGGACPRPVTLAELPPALLLWRNSLPSCYFGGTCFRPATLLSRLQVQENNPDVWIFRGPRSRVGVLRIGPANELGGAVLIPVGFSRQRDAGQLIHHDLLQPIKRLLLHLRVSTRSILVQQLIGGRIHPALVVGGSRLTDGGGVSAAQEAIVDVVGCGTGVGPQNTGVILPVLQCTRKGVIGHGINRGIDACCFQIPYHHLAVRHIVG